MLDIIIVCPFALDKRTVVEVRIIGMLEVESETGPTDKIIAVPTAEPRMAEVQEIEDLAGHIRAEISNFFQMDKSLEDKTRWSRFKSW